MGFVRRTDIRSFDIGTGLDWRFEKSVLRGAGTNLRMGYSTDHENRKLGWNVGLGSGMHFNSGDGFEVELNRSFDRVDEAFEIGDSEIPAGDYEIDEISLALGSSEIRPLSIGMRGSYGDFFDGTRVGYEMGSRWRVTYQLAIEANYDRNQIRLPDAKFSTNVFGTRISYSLNTRFFTKLFAQWNDTSDRFGANFLLHWIYRPGSDFYLVYDQRWNTEGGFDTEAWTVLGKTTYLLSF